MPDFLIHFFSMGGYGHFIWGAFGLSAIVIISLLLQSHYYLRSTETKLKSLIEEADKNEA